MPRFHCHTNPSFRLKTPRVDIRFTGGYYSTESKGEIELLRGDSHVVEVPYSPPGYDSAEDFFEDVKEYE